MWSGRHDAAPPAHQHSVSGPRGQVQETEFPQNRHVPESAHGQHRHHRPRRPRRTGLPPSAGQPRRALAAGAGRHRRLQPDAPASPVQTGHRADPQAVRCRAARRPPAHRARTAGAHHRCLPRCRLRLQRALLRERTEVAGHDSQAMARRWSRRSHPLRAGRKLTGQRAGGQQRDRRGRDPARRRSGGAAAVTAATLPPGRTGRCRPRL